ncbi:hypothetical protein J6590_069714 [Homalodisca vitripennis]|nr:hypothetical protein J6590_069714 [Homalodisca vitripennis]
MSAHVSSVALDAGQLLCYLPQFEQSLMTVSLQFLASAQSSTESSPVRVLLGVILCAAMSLLALLIMVLGKSR